ncbi:agmatine deiminase : Agmatine deiminase OS=Terriglobus saanensis (strain ATCC BAA-1853 / DSM 23119 / SP1PR4) GN=AciPR4_1790 PE=4 SV=1: PAD_porph [Gemmata massiliana]|uniref:Agmatine deiminase n=1 Tax=Gemmata massiliana TaxID=1210884 RepID=A0A6P2CZK1_9BACT|nr:agmatine deiminase family protein [Gemmata massiliana]VTR92592.1 agmatine deiminase : Agmatine deiminase OS=Terriglobus saanensis (strain ATCC BAA-1853 / DSM 23119 / SP1PR4) GN=AciPR4_1790 PE=4 SV=1: PAD_porph [Gemmata massiliana]
MTVPTLLDKPAARGYRMPAEWEPHAATWLGWPHRESDWPGRLEPIPWVYAEIVRALTRHEVVNLLVPDAKRADFAADVLSRANADMGRVKLWELPTDRSWLRDSGPIFVTNAAGERIALDWRFNAWAKYPDWQRDDLVPAFAAQKLNVPSLQPTHNGHRVVLEGGSIDVNGAGLLLTTEECLLSKTQERNPPFSRADYEQVFADYLGVKKVLWLNRGIVGDDTHGHIDDLARFVGARTVVTVVETNTADENYAILQENRERLESVTDLSGTKLEVVPLPMPRPLIFDGTRLPTSYANFYIANGVVIVPTFNDPADRVALGTLADLFPGREVVGISCVDLVWGLGTLHCMTQQEPL